ncbi:MAG: hypothetical protein ACOX6N_01900 [Patescibacteria group bacterium]
MPLVTVLAAFFLTNFLVLYLAPRFIDFIGFFPYRNYLMDFGLPGFISSLANFDGIHYLLISQRSYAQYEQSFFPLYPLIIRFLSRALNSNPLVTAIIFSNLALILSVYLTYRLLKLIKIQNAFLSIIFLLLFPTSFYFSAVYTESLFLLLFISSLLFFYSKKPLLAASFALLSSLTRVNGVFLAIPFLLDYLFSQKKSLKQLVLILSPFIGLSLYCLYLYHSTGDPINFVNSIPVYGRQTTPTIFPQVIYRYIKILLFAARNFQYWIALFELITFISFAAVLTLQLYRLLSPGINKLKNKLPLLSLNLISIATLILPTLTGTFSSLPRYVLMSLSFFIFLSEINSRYLKIALFIIFFVFHVLGLAFFAQGYFIS